jgi:hypothetical protein
MQEQKRNFAKIFELIQIKLCNPFLLKELSQARARRFFSDYNRKSFNIHLLLWRVHDGQVQDKYSLKIHLFRISYPIVERRTFLICEMRK